MHTIYDRYYRDMINELVAARKSAGMSQQDVAEQWGRDQSVIAKIEKCYRRIDLIEFVSLSVIVGLDYVKVAQDAEESMRAEGAIKPS